MIMMSEPRKVTPEAREHRKAPKSFFANIFGRMAPAQDFDRVKISIASPELIRSWSFGEVTKPETINYRTFKPERDGLFCAHIFGPIKDYECLCGKYKRMKYRGVVCEKCGVEVTLAKVRRERMGHIELAAPVAHIWFTKSLPSRIGTLLDLSSKDLDKIMYFESYVIIDPGITLTKRGQVLTADELQQLDSMYGVMPGAYGPKAFDADSGAEALLKLLKSIDLEQDRETLRAELEVATSELRRKKILKRLRLVEAFIHSGARPEWMVMQVLPVIPADLRPLVPLEVGRFAAADLNDLYRRVIHRNNRLKRLLTMGAPRIMVHNEKRMLQEIVDALFDNGRRGRPILGAHKKPLKPLTDTLRGKRGRFRQNLLGKRVDFSGRSVIVVGPDLKLHQCGLPKKMALELFKPFVYSKLESYGLAPTIKAAKRMVEKEQPEVWDVLEEVIRQHPVLLNRAPTLHRLGIQAFEPVLTEGKAIKLHPLVCGAYNADFDGDQMGVYVPLSVEAQLEARVLMMSTNNILSPAHGSPIILPSKDMVLGLYYMTMAPSTDETARLFSCSGEIDHALETKAITLHTLIRVSIEEVGLEGHRVHRVVETTPGRYILGQILPKHPSISFDLVNHVLNSAALSQIVELVYRHCGQKETVVFSDRLMEMGFRYATRSGISFGKNDLIVPVEKNTLIHQTRQKVFEYRKQYLDGLITAGERYNKVTDAWATCSEQVATVMMERLKTTVFDYGLSAAFLMVDSGARGSLNQMRQLAAFRGLIAKHSGEVIENPILSNFKEGLNILEYYISTYGARKGVSDVSLGTANAGYLTRRLVDVGQDCIITELDCGSTRGLRVSSVVRGEEVISTLGQQILGRVTLNPIYHSVTGELVVGKNHLITEELVEVIESSGVDVVDVRSVIMCKLGRGLCAMCYGRDLARGALVNPGEAVGVIAAQSIGEPGTQLTMRTFHSGGAAQRSSETSFLQTSLGGIVRLKNCTVLCNRDGVYLVNSRHAEIVVVDSQERERERYKLPYGATLFCQEGEEVKKGIKLAEWDPYMLPLMTESSGVVRFVDLVESVSLSEVIDESTGISKRVVSDWKQVYRGTDLRPRLVLTDENGSPVRLASGMEARYFLSVGTILKVEEGAVVCAGDILASLPRESSKSRDIIGGLPRIVELFEARRPKEAALMSEHEGRLEFGKDYKTKRRLYVVPDDDSLSSAEYVIPKGKHVLLQEGDEVKRGDVLVDGPLAPQDILRILGVEAVAYHMINEIQEVYRLQGVRINDKHLEVIIRQMLQKMEITDPGDTLWVAGDHIDYRELNSANKQLLAQGKKAASAFFVLQGITKASLQTNSFISSASFQETTRVLTEAAVWGKEDPLLGLKENVIVGHLIPAGTGSIIASLKKDILNRSVAKNSVSAA